MISFEELVPAIEARGAAGASLVNLRKSPTAQAAVQTLAPRCEFEAIEQTTAKGIVIYECRDRAAAGIPIKSPFGLACLDTQSCATNEDAEHLVGDLYALLRTADLHSRPALILCNSPAESVRSYLVYSETPLVVLTSAEIVDVMLAHPPRRALLSRIVAASPLSRLNPYVYRGPVSRNLFIGREDQLRKLTALSSSFGIIGPRAMGKTSLLNMAYDRLRREGFYVVSTEYSEALGEQGLVLQIIDGFIRGYGADEKLRLIASPHRVHRLIQDYVFRATPRRVVILIDEADLLLSQCPKLSAIIRLCHDQELAKFVLVGFTGLRKALKDHTNSILANLAVELPLAGLSREECGALVVKPMLELGIHFENVDEVVRVIYQDSGASPSRIQLLCYHIVESLGPAQSRAVNKEIAAHAIRMPAVRRFLNEWFLESTDTPGRWLAALASHKLPCPEQELIDTALHALHEITHFDVKDQIEDLITANIIDYQTDGRIDFTFSAMREIAGIADLSGLMAQLRQSARQSRRAGGGGAK